MMDFATDVELLCMLAAARRGSTPAAPETPTPPVLRGDCSKAVMARFTGADDAPSAAESAAAMLPARGVTGGCGRRVAGGG